MDKIAVKFGDWFQEGIELYKNNLNLLIPATFIALVLSCTFILAGPMIVSLLLMILRLHDKTKPDPELKDIFQGFDLFVPSLLFVLAWTVVFVIVNTILALIPCIGHLLSLLLDIVGPTFLMFGLFVIAEKNKDFWTASLESIDKVKLNFLPLLGLFIVSSIIGLIGIIACGIGLIVTIPIHLCILTIVYRNVFGTSVPVEIGLEPDTEDNSPAS
ncbi:MAG: hypothetical protein GKR87_00185 [Kiritimatiellae bacterium]|nr:hypothetical protein [Kiritimatiellia bacterium]